MGVYYCPAPDSFRLLEDALSKRVAGIAVFFKAHYADCASLARPRTSYKSELERVDVVDLGFSGTPFLLERMEIPLPGKDFMLQCRKEVAAWEKEQSSQGLRSSSSDTTPKVAAAECNFAVSTVEE